MYIYGTYKTVYNHEKIARVCWAWNCFDVLYTYDSSKHVDEYHFLEILLIIIILGHLIKTLILLSVQKYKFKFHKINNL